MFQVPWDDRPPHDIPNRQGIIIHRLKRGEDRVYRLLGPWKGAWHHRGKEHSDVCLGEQNHCPRCPDPYVFWEGYCPAIVWKDWMDENTGKKKGRWESVICPILDVMREDLSQIKGGVTGIFLTIRRNKDRKGLHHWTILERDHKAYAEPCPVLFDVEPILLRTWRIAWRIRNRAFLLSDDQAGVERPQQTSEGEAQPG